MAFMDPEIYFSKGTRVETNNGTCFIPSDVMTPPRKRLDDDSKVFAEWCKTAGDYCETGAKGIESLEPCKGYFARMSAAAYLDCTEWMCFDTRKEAEETLREYYGEDEDDDCDDSE